MKILIWTSCEASRASLCSQCWAKIKRGKMPEEILNRFDTNYIVLLVWKCTLLESLTIITLNYKHCKRAYSSPANTAIVCLWHPKSVKTFPFLTGFKTSFSCPYPLSCSVVQIAQALALKQGNLLKYFFLRQFNIVEGITFPSSRLRSIH